MRYRVKVYQTVSMVVEVDADTVEDAQTIAKDLVEATGNENAAEYLYDIVNVGEAIEVT